MNESERKQAETISSPEPERKASPQAEDGHVDIANEIVELLAKTNLSAYESRILWAIMRKTWGWHLKMAPISLTDFQKITGLDRKSVCTTLSRLLDRKIIKKGTETKKKFRRYSGDSTSAVSVTYGIQKNYFEWRDSGDSTTPVVNRPPKRVVVQPLPSDRKPLRDKGQRERKETKEIDTGVTRTKKKSAPEPLVKELETFWSNRFKVATGSLYLFSYGKDGQIFKNLLQIHPLDKIKSLIEAFFRDEQCKRRGFTIGIFQQEVNRLVGLKPREEYRVLT